MMSSDSDRELLQRFRLGNEQAFTALISRYGALVFRTAIRITRSRELAEDASQQVFALLAQRILQNRSLPVTLAGWLHRTASFTAMRAIRNEMTYRKKLAQLREQQSASVSCQDSNRLAEQLDAVLLKLSADERKLLLRATIHGLAWSPDGKRLACSHDDKLTIFNAADGKALVEAVYTDINEDLFAHSARHLSWRPDSGMIAFRILFQGGRGATSGKPDRVAGDREVFSSRLHVGRDQVDYHA